MMSSARNSSMIMQSHPATETVFRTTLYLLQVFPDMCMMIIGNVTSEFLPSTSNSFPNMTPACRVIIVIGTVMQYLQQATVSIDSCREDRSV